VAGIGLSIMLSASAGVETAFARLRAFAYANDQPLSQVAAAVIAQRIRFHPDLQPDAGASAG